jgi:tetratricopeptide (TPR) repeat protein
MFFVLNAQRHRFFSTTLKKRWLSSCTLATSSTSTSSSNNESDWARWILLTFALTAAHVSINVVAQEEEEEEEEENDEHDDDEKEWTFEHQGPYPFAYVGTQLAKKLGNRMYHFVDDDADNESSGDAELGDEFVEDENENENEKSGEIESLASSAIKEFKKPWPRNQSLDPRLLPYHFGGFVRVDEADECDEDDSLHSIFDECDSAYSDAYETDRFVPMCEQWRDRLHAELERYPPSAELQWRLARAAHYLARAAADDDERKMALTREAHEHAEMALYLDDALWLAHKWSAVTLFGVAELEGIRSKILNSYRCRDLLERAIGLNPSGDATTHHLVGIWCFAFADLPWYQRKIASALLAEPPTSSYEEALEHFLRAERLEPAFYPRNTLMIASCYNRLGNHARALEWIKRTLDMPIENDDDREAHREAENLGQKIDKSNSSYYRW